MILLSRLIALERGWCLVVIDFYGQLGCTDLADVVSANGWPRGGTHFGANAVASAARPGMAWASSATAMSSFRLDVESAESIM
jgi:hypothetical protein